MIMIDYAKRELDILCPPDENGRKDQMQEMADKNVLDIVAMFAEQGHSGMTASYVLNILDRVLRYKPIKPLTGADDEWNDIGNGQEQNRRCSSVFRYNHDNTTAYDSEGKVFSDDGGQTFYSCRESHVPVTFPYTPPTHPEHVILNEAEPTTAEMQLQMAIEDAEQFMKKAPYLGYDHAKNLIAAAKRVLEDML